MALLTQLWPGSDETKLLRSGDDRRLDRTKFALLVQCVVAEHAFLYDRVVLPTQDFEEFVALTEALPVGVLRDALEQRAIAFMRVPTSLTYANGVGLSLSQIRKSPFASSHSDETLVRGWGETSDAAELATRVCPHIPGKERAAMSTALTAATTTYAPLGDTFERIVAEETYDDIIGDPVSWREIVQDFKDAGSAVRLPSVPDRNLLRRLGQIDPITGPRGFGTCFRIGRLNWQVAASGALGLCDLAAPDGSARLLKNKLERGGIRRPNRGRFVDFLDLPDVPDIPSALVDGRVDFATVWQARCGRGAEQFRVWLREANPADGKDLVRKYHEALKTENFVSAPPGRVIRWAILAVAGAAASRILGVTGEVVAGAAGLVDTLFLDNWIRGYRPSLFIRTLSGMHIVPRLK